MISKRGWAAGSTSVSLGPRKLWLHVCHSLSESIVGDNIMSSQVSKTKSTALIVGISDIVVQQTVLELAKQGYFVIYVDSNQDLIERVKQKLVDQGLAGWGVHFDYWGSTEIKSLFTLIKEGHGTLDLVITHLNLECETVALHEDSKLVALCINRTFRICAESWLQMISEGGVITNILPTRNKASTRPEDLYVSIGHAITQLSDKFSNDCIPYGIQCSSERIRKEDRVNVAHCASQRVRSMANSVDQHNANCGAGSGANAEVGRKYECISE